LVWADAPPTSEDSLSQIPKDYPVLLIGPGDLLFITVYGENGSAGGGGGGVEGAEMSMSVDTQLPTDYQVDSNGVITFPFLGNVNLAGLTPAEASAKLAKLLDKPRKVSVLVRESNTYWVSILGNVAKPGKYQIKGTPNLLSALAEAGGPLPETDMGGAILVHNNVKSKLPLDKYLQGTGPIIDQPYLYPGDTLMIQRSGWPSIGEIAIVASILASAAVVTVELSNLHH
jgi:protein involved in polysaccharide export with SLBB domain